MAFKRNTAMTRKILSVLMALCMLMGMFGCARVDIPETQQSETDSTTSDSSVTTAATTVTEPPQTTATSQTEPPPPDIRTVHLVCAGDNLIHSSIYKQAKRRAEANGEDGYDFDYVYEKVEKYLDGADIAILNQETIVTDELEPSDYPRFCSPADLGEKMIEMGFNAFSLSNNHILDRGEEGLLATLRFWDSHEGIIRHGAYRDE